MGKQWITLPQFQGISSRQAHADLPAGTYERELGKHGFFGPATHMYHRHPPTGWSTIEGPLRPRAFDLNRLDHNSTSPYDTPVLLRNAHLSIRIWQIVKSMDYLLRNADGDELLFIHQGKGALFCDYGHLPFSEGDYILLPRGTLWRLEVEQTTSLLLIEASNNSYQLPEKGIVGQHAIFDPAALDIPHIDATFSAQQTETEWRIFVKRHDMTSTITYPYNPLDACGWHGNLMPVKLNWRDIRPLMSHRYHVPPSAHTTFVSDRFVVCTFCPRPIEIDPGALKVPFFHNNDDFDEVIFYHHGEFFSRDNIHPGMLTLHPSGITHGPHPQAFDRGKNAERTATNEVAVMIDSRDALVVDPEMESIELKNYANSWKVGPA